MVNRYALWREELREPIPESDRASRPVDPTVSCGFWRISAARTKPSSPVAIWPQDGASGPVIFFMVGAGKVEGESMFDTLTAHERVQNFLHNGSWLKCSAVSEDAYHAAMETGYWVDGQPSRRISETERLDLVPDTPQAQGGNNPVGEDGEPIDLFHQQVTEKIDAEIAKWKALQPLDTLEKANAAAGIRDTLRLLWKQADGRKKEEDAPWNDKLYVIEDKWGHYLRDSKSVATDIFEAIDVFKRAEVQRLQREADEKEKIERERLEIENRKMAEQYGMTVDDEALKEMVDQQIAAAPAPVIEAPRVGTAFGRAVSKAKTRTARIVDVRALAEHFIHAADEDFTAYLQKRADAAARAKITLPGTKIDE